MLSSSQPTDIQAIAARVICGHRKLNVPSTLLASYRKPGASTRAEAVKLLFSRPAWHVALLDAIDAGTIKPAEIPCVRRNALVRSSNSALGERSSRCSIADRVADVSHRLERITLIRTTGTREPILRSDIEEIGATSQPLMPPAWNTESPTRDGRPAGVLAACTTIRKGSAFQCCRQVDRG